MTPGRFFFAPEEVNDRVRLLRSAVPDAETIILAQADQVLKHRFALLGYDSLDYGAEVDWHLDRVHETRAPARPWTSIRYLDFAEAGDVKVTWELNRHQSLVTLAKAWVLTGQEKYEKGSARLYRAWHAQNPYPAGVNWTSSLEAAFRSLSWLWVRELLGAGSESETLRAQLSEALAAHAWYIRRYLSTYFSPNTHLLGEGVALFFIGTMCPQYAEAAAWQQTGWQIVTEHARTRVRPDGAYFEQSTYYHVYALDLFLHARILAERNRIPVPPGFDDTLRSMLDFLALQSQAGPPPRFGDDDGGRVFDGRRNRAEHLVDPLALGAAFFRTGTYKLPIVRATEEMIWLLGRSGLETFQALPEATGVGSARFPYSGVYVMQGGQGTASQLIMDAGPLGGGSGGHGHADALSLTVNVAGTPVLTDPGTGEYVGPGNDRDTFRTTASHNTATVDGRSQAQPRSPFSWGRWPEVTVHDAVFTPGFDLLDAAHDGYASLAPPCTHRRCVLAPHDGMWIVLDRFHSGGPHDLAVRWHLPPGGIFALQSEVVAWAQVGGKKVQFAWGDPSWRATVLPYSYSPAYGAKAPAELLCLERRLPSSGALVTMLSLSQEPVSVEPVPAGEGVQAVRLRTGEAISLWIAADAGPVGTVEEWSTDARYLYVTLDGDGRPRRFIQVGGGFVRFRGETLWESPGSVDHFAWQRETRP
jgi:hypothetical protein